MSLVESLLSAIIRLDGDALVLHVGEKPYVVTSSSAMNAFRGPLVWGQVELSTRPLAAEAVTAMLDQLLTTEQRRVLDEISAVESILPASDERPAFSVIAARGGDDIWIEVRPVKVKAAPEPAAAAEAEPTAHSEPAESVAGAPAALGAVERVEPVAVTEPPAEAPIETAPIVAAEQPAPVTSHEPQLEVVHEEQQRSPDERDVLELLTNLTQEVSPIHASQPETAQAESGAPPRDTPTLKLVPPPQPEAEVPHAVLEAPEPELVPPQEVEAELTQVALEAPAPQPETPMVEVVPPQPEVDSIQGAPEAPQPEAEAGDARRRELERATFDAETGEAEAPTPAVVVPLSRTLRETTPVQPVTPVPILDRLLKIAAARGASGLYLVAQSVPMLRVEGVMQQLAEEQPLTSQDIEAFALHLTPEPNREAVRSGATPEWFCELPELGRVRCLGFRDHRGPGLIVRMLPPRAISAEQLGLSREIQALCAQPDGLVLVAGPRSSGKSTLVAAFVDLVNRTRSDHVVTIERQITFVHSPRRSFVSQREVRGEAEEIASAVRAALREDSDVLVVEDLRSPEIVASALEAAESGRLVVAGLRAPGTVQAVQRLIEQFPPDRRRRIESALASTLRGVIAQVLLHKRGGGRVAARELLLNTPAAAALIAEGKAFQLHAAIESDRRLGSVALNDTLVALIRDGIVDPGEAWRRAWDRDGLLTLLKREGIDTSFVERLA